MTPALKFDGLERVTLPHKAVHLAIGMFDGVHLGHRAVIDAAIQSARRAGGLAGVLTFWPHPSALVRPAEAARMITGRDLRERLLAESGVDFVITQAFEERFASISAAEFLPHVRRFIPHLRSIYVGENWRFGKGRTGDVAFLVRAARDAGLSVVSAERINHNGEAISSTRIRQCLERGAIEEANALLGYTYFSEGIVTPGRQLGRTLGFPTLNIAWEPELPPRLGVYAAAVTWHSGEALPAVCNYGVRPTVENKASPRLEVHVLGSCDAGPGDTIRVEWLSFLRAEMKFSGLSELQAQIAKDREAALAYFTREAEER